MSEWVTEKSNYRRAYLSKMINMPQGPYVVCCQTDHIIFDGMHVSRVLKEFKDKIISELPKNSCPGVVGFYFNKEDKLEICFKHFDSSD